MVSKYNAASSLLYPPQESSISSSTLPWWPLIGSFLIHSSIGYIYTFGNMLPYLLQYMQKYTNPNLQTPDLIWAYTLSMASQGFFIIFANGVEKKLGRRRTLIFSTSLISIGVISTALSIKNYTAFLLTYGFMTGIGCGLSFQSPLACAIEWWPDNQGWATGVTFFGRSLSVLLFTPIQLYFLRSQNISLSGLLFGEVSYSYDIDKIPEMLINTGLVMACLQVVGIILLFRPEHSKSKNLDIDSMVTSSHDLMSPLDTIKSSNVWALCWAQLFVWPAMLYIQVYWKIIGSLLNDSEVSVTSIGILSSICGAVGRLCWGILSDKVSYSTSLILNCAIHSVVLILLPWVTQWGFISYILWICSVAFIQSGFMTIVPVLIFDKYGSVNFGFIFSLLYFLKLISSLLFPVFISVLVDRVQVIGLSAFLSLSVFSGFGFLIAHTWSDPKQSDHRD